MSCRNSVLFRNLLLVSALFAQAETLYRAENSVFFRNLLLVSALFVQVETLVFRGTWAVVHQRKTSVRFRHQRNLQAFFVTFCLFAF